VTVGGQAFHLEVAADDATRQQGLSDRPSIAADGGMLFVYDEDRHRAFVMRRCLVPIDILFVDAALTVVAAHSMEVEAYGTPSWRLRRYQSGRPCRYVIELRGGTLAALGVEPGDRVGIPLDRLDRPGD
jgi:uncharacterized membrane protein (UPF0127 family)